MATPLSRLEPLRLFLMGLPQVRRFFVIMIMIPRKARGGFYYWGGGQRVKDLMGFL